MTKLQNPIQIKKVTRTINGRERTINKPQINFDPKHPLSTSKTHQSFLKETNINTIMRNYSKTGILGSLNKPTPIYGDFSDIDFQTEQLKVVKTQTAFDQLPQKLKEKFQNSPQKLINYLKDPKNKEEAIKLNIIAKPNQEPYMMVDLKQQPTGVMKHPGKTAKETKYYKDGNETNSYGLPIPKPAPEGESA